MKLNRLAAVIILSLIMVFASGVILAHADEEVPSCPVHKVPMVYQPDVDDVTPATCREPGARIMYYHCSVPDCDETDFVVVKIAATGKHDFSGEMENKDDKHSIQCKNCDETVEKPHEFKVVSTVAPECEKDGKIVYKCVCGAEKEEKIQATGHQHLDFIETVEANCRHGGYDLYKCVDCEKEIEKNKTSKLSEHNWSDPETVAPTCTAQGYTFRVCADCSKPEYTNYVAATGHDFQTVPEVAPTCEKDGKKAYKKCSVCDALDEDGEGAVIPMLNHKNNKKVEAVAATCKDSGTIEYYKCLDCGKVSLDRETWVKNDKDFQSQIVDPKTDVHDWKVIPAKEPTCTEDGWSEYQICKICKKVEGAEFKAKTGHKAETYEPEKPATCEEKGKKAYAVCDNCKKIFAVIVDADNADKFELGDEVTEAELVIPALDHDYVTVGEKPVTCTEDGFTGMRYCSVCDKIDPEFTPKIVEHKGHSYVNEDGEEKEYEIVEEATCQKEGKKSRTCNNCDYADEVTIPKDEAHEYCFIVAKTKEPTCTEAGYELRKCEYCKYEAKITKGYEAKGHKPIAVEAKAPTETEDGWTAGYKCEDCGVGISGCEKIPATGVKEYGKYSIENVSFNSNGASGKVVVTDGAEYDRVYARVTVWFNDFQNYITLRAEVIDDEFEVGYGVNNISGITVIITTEKNCASVPMDSIKKLAVYEI